MLISIHATKENDGKKNLYKKQHTLIIVPFMIAFTGRRKDKFIFLPTWFFRLNDLETFVLAVLLA